MYNVKSPKAEEFISDEEIRESLDYAEKNKSNVALIDEILNKARKMKGISHREALVLLDCDIPEKNEEIYKLAREIKQEFYGNRIVMFAPLYLSNTYSMGLFTGSSPHSKAKRLCPISCNAITSLRISSCVSFTRRMCLFFA